MVSLIFRRSALLILALGVYLLAPASSQFSSQVQAASCNSLAKEFKKKGRPRFMRVVNRNRSIANYYNSTLKRLQSRSTPTRAEMRKAYRATARSCSTQKCRSDARRIYNASLKLHSYNRRWVRSGCRGTLS